jgi:hypothetical protein
VCQNLISIITFIDCCLALSFTAVEISFGYLHDLNQVRRDSAVTLKV